jgi:NADPH:quinone reductase-like Zn-dependent oxidoreductase
MPVPPSFSYDQAAAVAIVYPTAYNALITHGELRTGQSVLIQGAASAVGIAALQIAKASGAHRVIGTGRSVTRGATLPSLALDRYLVVGTDDIAAEVSRLTDGCGVGVIIDMVGGAALADNITSIALGGRIVNVGWMGGTKGELDLDTLARKRVTLIGVSFRTRTLEQKAELFQAFTRDMFPFFESGALRPIVQRTYPLAQAAAAQSAMALDEHLGKIVLHP